MSIQPVPIQPVPMDYSTSTLSTYRDGKKVQCPGCESALTLRHTHTQASSDTDDTTSDVTVVTESAVSLVGTLSLLLNVHLPAEHV